MRRKENKRVLLARLQAWEAERDGDWHKMAYLADETIGALREEIEKRWPGTLEACGGSEVSGG